jgi:hypothetical protein
MDFHVVHVTSEIPSYMEKQKRWSINAGPEFRANLHGKHLVIDESLY